MTETKQETQKTVEIGGVKRTITQPAEVKYRSHKSSCKRCHGTGKIGRDTATGTLILCSCKSNKTPLKKLSTKF